MKVKLINVAEYELKEGNATEIPFKTFVNLCGNVGASQDLSLPIVRLFKSMDEFRNLTTEEMYDIEQTESIRVLPNGQFLVFLKKTTVNKEEGIKSTLDNATTDTKENKGK